MAKEKKQWSVGDYLFYGGIAAVLCAGAASGGEREPQPAPQTEEQLTDDTESCTRVVNGSLWGTVEVCWPDLDQGCVADSVNFTKEEKDVNEDIRWGREVTVYLDPNCQPSLQQRPN